MILEVGGSIKQSDIVGNGYDKQLKIKILPLLQEFIDIFRKELPATPAKIEPMKLTLIEGSDWYINSVYFDIDFSVLSSLGVIAKRHPNFTFKSKHIRFIYPSTEQCIAVRFPIVIFRRRIYSHMHPFGSQSTCG